MATPVTTAPQGSPLARLPKELLDNIASSLPTLDFNALRRTCKDVEDKSFKYWSKCFFKKKQFMIEEFSLQTLVDISEHPALSKVLTHLIIGLDELQACVPQGNSVEFSRWRDADNAQKALLSGGGAAGLLSTALANLPKLETVDIRDFNSDTRFRDAILGQEAPPWRSYGASKYEQWPRESQSLCSVIPGRSFVDTVFTVVLTAVGRSSATPKNLELILRNRSVRLQDDALALGGLALPGSRSPLDNSLPALTKLHLDLDSRGSANGRTPAHYNVRVPWPQHAWFDPCTENLRRFLARARNVTWLRLNFHPGGNSPTTPSSKLMSWLSLNPGFNAPVDAPWGQGNPAPITLPLQRLDLGNLTITSATLHGLLKKFADLERIVLRDIRLLVPAGVSDQDGTDCVCARLIRSLNTTNPKLKKLELSRIREGTENNLTNIVWADDEPGQVSISTSTQVHDTKTLDKLADRTWTMTRWEKVHAYQSGGEDEDSVDEDSFDELSVDGDDDEDTE